MLHISNHPPPLVDPTPITPRVLPPSSMPTNPLSPPSVEFREMDRGSASTVSKHSDGSKAVVDSSPGCVDYGVMDPSCAGKADVCGCFPR